MGAYHEGWVRKEHETYQGVMSARASFVPQSVSLRDNMTIAIVTDLVCDADSEGVSSTGREASSEPHDDPPTDQDELQDALDDFRRSRPVDIEIFPDGKLIVVSGVSRAGERFIRQMVKEHGFWLVPTMIFGATVKLTEDQATIAFEIFEGMDSELVIVTSY
jgi:hypothetical protein